jgi:Zinc dependent phospholipase C
VHTLRLERALLMMPRFFVKRPITARIATVSLLALLLGPASPVAAFSVLAHQAVVDQCWDDTIVPALRDRFPDASPDQIAQARAYAHGGSHVADLGYFPFGNRLFTDLVHYVRSGEFVGALVAAATTVDEYAFALGAVSHWVSDSIGHPEVTNRTVPEIYPKLREAYGDVVTYADDHSAHLQTEFRLDVLQVAHSPQSLDLFTHALDFEVAEPVLDRAFRQTYGLGLDDVFADKTMAITTYRWAFRGVIHEATGIAWELYRADIEKLDPSMTPAAFVYDLSREDFEKEFGSAYREPGFFAKAVAFVVKLVPNVGPFKRLPYKPLPADAQARFDEGLRRIVVKYRAVVRGHRPSALTNLNLDTGHATRRGEYEPADEAYAELLDKLDDRHFAAVPPALRADILRFYASAPANAARGHDDDEKLRRALTQLAAAPRGH